MPVASGLPAAAVALLATLVLVGVAVHKTVFHSEANVVELPADTV